MLLYDSWWIFAAMLVACGAVGLLMPQSLWWLVILVCAGIGIVGNLMMHHWHMWRERRRIYCELASINAVVQRMKHVKEGGDGDAE